MISGNGRRACIGGSATDSDERADAVVKGAD